MKSMLDEAGHTVAQVRERELGVGQTFLEAFNADLQAILEVRSIAAYDDAHRMTWCRIQSCALAV
jgi:hypothetical protein